MPANLEPLLRRVQRLVAPPPAEPDADAVLLNRFIQNRDEAAFAALVTRHTPMVLGVCRRVLGDAQHAEDALQATFLVLARKAAMIRRPDALAGWLHGVARRVALKARPSAACRRMHETCLSAADPPDARPDPLAEVSARELLTAIDEEVQRLPKAYRLPVILCCLQGWTQEEAARRLGWTAGSVKGRLERGRVRLHARLERRGLTLSAALAAVALTRPTATATATAAMATAVLRAGGEPAPGAVSAQAAALAEEVARGLAGAKLRLVVVLLIAAGLGGAGAGVAAYRAWTAAVALAPRDSGQPATAEPQPPKPAGAQRVRTDRYGDSLPPHALVRLGTTRMRVGGRAMGHIFLADNGRTVIARGDDGVIRSWDAATGREKRSFRLGTGYGNASIAYSPDGKQLAYSDYAAGDTIHLVSLATGKELRQFGGHGPRGIHGFAFAPDGRTLAVAGADDAIQIWDVADGKQLRHFALPRGLLYTGLAFLPDGKHLIFNDWAGGVRVWQLDPAREVRRFPGVGQDPQAFAVSRNGKVLALAPHDIILYEPASGKEVRRIKSPDGRVYNLALSPDGRLLAAAKEAHVRLWDTRSGKEVFPIRVASWAIGSLAFSSDGRLFAFADSHALRLFDTTTGQERFAEDAPVSDVGALAWSPDGRTLVTTGKYGRTPYSLYFWDAATATPRRRVRGDTQRAAGILFTPDDKALITAELDDAVHVRDPATGKERRRLAAMPTPAGQNHVMLGAGLALDGRTVTALRLYEPMAPGPDTFTVDRWDYPTGKSLVQCRREWTNSAWGRREVATYGYVSPDGELFALAGTDVSVRDARTGAELLILPGKKDHVFPAIFAPDGRSVAALCYHDSHFDGKDWHQQSTLLVWELATGKEIAHFKPAGLATFALAFSPDGRFLASGNFNGSPVQIWDLATGREAVRLDGLRASASALAFSPDGRRLAGGLQDTTTLIWDVSSLDLRSSETSSLGSADLNRMWADLGDADAVKAQAAVWSLVLRPRQAIPLLKRRLPPAAAPDPARLRRLLADLDSNRFAVRRAAFAELQQLGDVTAPAIRKMLGQQPSLEVRRRLEQLLPAPGVVRSQVTLRTIRAVQVLERVGTPEARTLLRTLADGTSAARLTTEARAALARLETRR